MRQTIRPLRPPAPICLLCALLICATAGATAGATAAPPPERHAHFHLPGSNSPTTTPKRIVSLAPVLTETLFALGVGGRVVGVTRFCDRPAAATKLPKVGGFVDPSIEAILALKPDFVVAMPSFGQRKTLDLLRQAGLPVFVAFADSIAEVKDLLRALGTVVDRPKRGQQLANQLSTDLKAMRNRLAKSHPSVAILVATKPLVLAGPGTFATEALTLLGARSVVVKTSIAWPTWSLEALLSAQPEVIVVAEGQFAAQHFRNRLRELGIPHSASTVVAAPAAILMRPGPGLTKDIETLAKLLETR